MHRFSSKYQSKISASLFKLRSLALNRELENVDMFFVPTLRSIIHSHHLLLVCASCFSSIGMGN